ncbi:MAG: type IX secretion system plug protein domain-containing protein [Bacteroidota bacterium]
MMKLLALFLAICLVSNGAPGQWEPSPVLKGLRLFGQSRADLPITLLREEPMTIEFDVQADKPPRLELRFYHCDREWNTTPTSFVNDEFLNKTRLEIPFEASPVGVKGYAYQYSFRIPGHPLFDGFLFSGNYRLEIWDAELQEELASARFFVAEQLLQPEIKVINRRDPATSAPRNQVHLVRVAFAVPPPDSAATMPYFSHDFTAVDVYKNRELTRPWRVSVDDDDPNTFVEGLATQFLEFRIENIVPGNEYRTIDLESVNQYPQHMELRPRGGADLSRFPWRRASDKDGSSSIVRGNRYAEYLDFQFELLWDVVSDSVFVVGDFNGWDPRKGGPMELQDGRYTWKTSVGRGRYDYQYVVGSDWIALEGNDWRTINRYTALIYYRDPRFGGFDRIVGVARTRSSGGLSEGN